MVDENEKPQKRLFIGLKVPLTEFKDWDQMIKKLKVSADKRKFDFKWTQPESYHVTLEFLGQTDIEMVSSITTLMEDIGQQQAPFRLQIKNLGVFPTAKSGRVLWVGCSTSQHLLTLKEHLGEKLQKQGFPADERDFSPHITIGRLRNKRSLADYISPFENKKLGRIDITEFTLFESQQRGPFNFYHPLHTTQLSGSLEEEEDISVD